MGLSPTPEWTGFHNLRKIIPDRHRHDPIRTDIRGPFQSITALPASTLSARVQVSPHPNDAPFKSRQPLFHSKVPVVFILIFLFFLPNLFPILSPQSFKNQRSCFMPKMQTKTNMVRGLIGNISTPFQAL
jgi:hypothetical protein